MNSTMIALFVAGIVLLGFEILLPGAVMGIAAGVSLLAAVAVAFAAHGVTGGVLALAAAILAVFALLFVEFRVLPKTRLGRRMFLTKSIDATSQPPVAARAADVVGRDAVALTALGPTGVVQVDGRRYEARCESGFAAEGARLRVVRVETFQLVVIASG